MNHEIIYELQYEVQSAPEYLTFEQKFTGESDLLPAEMLLQVKQENAGKSENYGVELSVEGQPSEKLNLFGA